MSISAPALKDSPENRGNVQKATYLSQLAAREIRRIANIFTKIPAATARLSAPQRGREVEGVEDETRNATYRRTDGSGELEKKKFQENRSKDRVAHSARSY